MDDDLDPGITNTETDDTAAQPSLTDAVASEFGFGDDAADGGGESGQGAADAAGATPAAGQPGAAADGAGAPAVAAAADPNAPKPGDKPDPNAELYAPLPEHNPRKTHERFQRLVEGHKEEVTKREAAEQQVETFKTQVQQYEAGLQPLREMGFDSPEAVGDLQQFSHYRKALAGGDVETAMGILQQQMQQLQLLSGRRIDVNPLAAFPDLAERVRVGELDEQTALELGRARHVQRTQQDQRQRHTAAETQHQQQVQRIQAGVQAVNQTVRELERDPDFKAVEPALLQHLGHIKSNYLPHQWADQIKRTYDYERRLLLAQQQSQQNRTAPPLRGSGHQGGSPAPKTAADAAFQALGMT
jgi:hypothetical protein